MALNKLLICTRRGGPSPANDPQRERVYCMEREFIGQAVGHSTPRAHLEEIIRDACRRFGVDEPALRIVNKPERVYARYFDDESIRLNRGFHGDNVSTLLHELAHHLTWKLAPTAQDHGAEWCAIYRRLLHLYRMMPRAGFDALARKYRLRVAARCPRRR
jgi:predicted SprT family Zn-dependent metalloprotease